MARGPAIKLKGREKDRVLSEYMEMLSSQNPTAAKLPGARGVAFGILAMAIGIPPLAFTISQQIQVAEMTRIISICALLVLIFTLTLLLATGAIGPRRRLWWAAMRKCGHNVCIQCGYLLEHRAADSQVCPECGLADAEQPVALGERTAIREWPRYQVEPVPDSKEPESTDRA